MLKEKIIIYTDGAAKGNPGQAGWAAVVLLYPHLAFGSHPKRAPYSRGRSKEGVLELGGRVDHATNNQMELTAPIEALKYILTRQDLVKSSIEIVSDSKYVILGITEWIFNWQKNNWRNVAKKPVLNKELWQELFILTEKLKPKWSYVEGHTGHKHNERADEIATSFAEGGPVKLRK